MNTRLSCRGHAPLAALPPGPSSDTPSPGLTPPPSAYAGAPVSGDDPPDIAPAAAARPPSHSAAAADAAARLAGAPAGFTAGDTAAERESRGEASVNAAFASFQSTGDREMLASVVRETAGPLRRAAQALTKDIDTAEDLVQTTFLTAMDSASSFDSSRPVVPWLLGILQNRARRLHRAKTRSFQRLPDADEHPADPDSTDPRDYATRREFVNRVHCAIARTPTVYQPVLHLYLRAGLTPFEVSRALDRPRSTVRTQLARGLAMVRAELGDPDFGSAAGRFAEAEAGGVAPAGPAVRGSGGDPEPTTAAQNPPRRYGRSESALREPARRGNSVVG